MIRGIPNASVPTLNYTLPYYGKMSLPVDSSSLIYSHFKHVSGIAAPEGTQGVSISKLNLLDVLIGQVSQIKKSNVPAVNPAEGLDSRRLDALIDSYRTQIKQAKTASEAMPYIPSPNAQSGALFSIIT